MDTHRTRNPAQDMRHSRRLTPTRRNSAPLAGYGGQPPPGVEYAQLSAHVPLPSPGAGHALQPEAWPPRFPQLLAMQPAAQLLRQARPAQPFF